MDPAPTPGDEPTAPDTATDSANAEHHAVTPMRASIAMMIVGALVLFVGMLSTTAATPQPECADGTELVAKFEVKGSNYVFEKPAGNEQIVELVNPTLSGGNWISTTPISEVIVKGGPGSKATTYDPAQLKGTFSNASLPPVGKGNQPDISNIQFCAPKTPTTTSTSSTTEVRRTAFVRITAICLDQQGYRFRVRHESGAAPVDYRLQIADNVLYGPATIGSGETQFVHLAPPKAGVKVVLVNATNDYKGTASTNDVACESPDTTTTTEATTTTTEPATTTEPTTTTEGPTTTTEGPTTTESPTTTEATTTTAAPTTSEGPTTTGGESTTTTAADGTPTTQDPEVAGAVEVATKVTPNDAEAQASVLAFTGGSSLPMLVIGIVMLLAGATLALVTRARSRQAAD